MYCPRLSDCFKCSLGFASVRRFREMVLVAMIVALAACGIRNGNQNEVASVAEAEGNAVLEYIAIAYFSADREQAEETRTSILSLMNAADIPVLFEGKSGFTDVFVLNRELVNQAKEILQSSRTIVARNTTEFRILQENGKFREL